MMTENVYVIKVKTKPPLSSLYPSERRYSASTVGGLALVHFGLGALSLLLGTFALSLQGPILSVACLMPFVTGLLAWRRWYIDRNITIFFYGSLFSLVIAVLCFVVTIFDIAAAAGNASGGSLWPLGRIFSAPRYSPSEDLANGTRANDIASAREDPFNVTGDRNPFRIDESSGSPVTLILSSIESDLRDGSRNSGYSDDIKAESSLALEERTITSGEIFQNEDGSANVTRESVGPTKDKAGSFWRDRYEGSSHAGTLLTLNVLMASLLEAFWSLLSARIAFRGMTNRLPECSNVVVGTKATSRLPLQKRKPPAPKPDILDHDRRLSESLRSFASLQGLNGPGPRLPLPESSREFRERVEKFLANQATHRIVEGA